MTCQQNLKTKLGHDNKIPDMYYTNLLTHLGLEGEKILNFFPQAQPYFLNKGAKSQATQIITKHSLGPKSADYEGHIHSINDVVKRYTL